MLQFLRASLQDKQAPVLTVAISSHPSGCHKYALQSNLSMVPAILMKSVLSQQIKI